MNEFNRGAVCFFSFNLPICRAGTDFKATFKGFLDDPATSSLIEAIVQAKAAMLVAMTNKAMSYDEKIVLVDQYLSLLYNLYESLTAQGGVKVSTSLYFDWVLYINGTGESFRSNDMILELIMLLHLKALLHFYLARHLLDTDVKAFLSEAGKSFLVASSIMDYLQIKLGEQWGGSHRLHPSQPNPIEATAAACAAMSLYYRTCAQVCAALKASEGAASSAVKARVAVAAINYAAKTLDAAAAAKLPNKPFSAHIALSRQLFSSLAFLQVAQGCYEREEVGAAVGALQVASAHIAEQQGSKYELSKVGLPKAAALPSVLAPARQQLMLKIQELLTAAERDNRFVHFQMVTQPALPAEAAVMVPPQPFTGPVLQAQIVFKANERSSVLGSFFGFGKASSAGAATAAEEATAPPAEPSSSSAGYGVYTPSPAPGSSPYAAPAPVSYAAPAPGSSPPASAPTYAYNSNVYPTYAPAAPAPAPYAPQQQPQPSYGAASAPYMPSPSPYPSLGPPPAPYQQQQQQQAYASAMPPMNPGQPYYHQQQHQQQQMAQDELMARQLQQQMDSEAQARR